MCPPVQHQCPQAKEAEELIQHIWVGFPLADMALDLSKLAPIITPYRHQANGAHHAALVADAEAKIIAGHSFRTSETQRFVCGTFIKEEPKPGGVTKLRPIVDPSVPNPEGVSINSLSAHQHFHLTTRDVVGMLRSHHYLFVVDIRGAYTQLGIYPPHWPLAATWDPSNPGTCIINTRGLFGSAANAESCNRVTGAVAAIMGGRGYPVKVWFDDFFGAVRPEYGEGALASLVALLDHLGLPDEPRKRQTGTQVIWCGTQYDTDTAGTGGVGLRLGPAPQATRRRQPRGGARAAPTHPHAHSAVRRGQAPIHFGTHLCG